MPRDYNRRPSRYGAQSRDEQDRVLREWAAERERGQQGSVRRSPALPYVPSRRGPRSRNIGEWWQQFGEDERDDRRYEAARRPRSNPVMADFAHACAAVSDAADRNVWLVVEVALRETGSLSGAAEAILSSRQITGRSRQRALDLLINTLEEKLPCPICGKSGTGADAHSLHCPLRKMK